LATDIATVVQITSSPFESSSTTVNVPTTDGNSPPIDNLIDFTFDNESIGFANVFLMGWDSVNQRYNYGHVDASARSSWGASSINRISGLTESTGSASTSGYLISDTDIFTGFDNASFRIALTQALTGAANGSDPSTFDTILAHGYIFFIFPA